MSLYVALCRFMPCIKGGVLLKKIAQLVRVYFNSSVY